MAMFKRKYVVVFDIDGTLCCKANDQIDDTKIANPECPIIYHPAKYRDQTYVFIPYLPVLINYLISSQVRIVFFSSASEDRNSFLITKLFEEILGDAYYQSLKSQGQFDILSEQHMRRGNGAEGNYVKDLSKVVHINENLLDAILIEDQPSYAANDQKPCIYIIDCEFWKTSDQIKEASTFPKNTTYYLLGLFKSYFENDEYKKLPLREGIKKILPEEKLQYTSQMKESTFVHQMICLGLSEVRKSCPEAIFYGYEVLEKNSFEGFSHDHSIEAVEEILGFSSHHSKEAVEEILGDILYSQKTVVNSTITVFLKYVEDRMKHLQSNVVEDYFLKIKSMIK